MSMAWKYAKWGTLAGAGLGVIGASFLVGVHKKAEHESNVSNSLAIMLVPYALIVPPIMGGSIGYGAGWLKCQPSDRRLKFLCTSTLLFTSVAVYNIGTK